MSEEIHGPLAAMAGGLLVGALWPRVAAAWRRPAGFWRGALALGAAAALAVVITAAPLHRGAGGHGDDSLFSLSARSVAVVLAISVALGFAALSLSLAKTRWLQSRWPPAAALALDLAATPALFWAGYALAPQLYYSFYQTIFERLPRQWVTRNFWDLSPLRLAASLPETADLATQGAGVAFWTVILATLGAHAAQAGLSRLTVGLAATALALGGHLSFFAYSTG